MRLNANKCKVMDFSGSNLSRIYYTMEDLDSGCRVSLEGSCCERDLEIQISSDLKWKTHISTIVSKANKVIGLLLKTFTSRDSDLWKMLYISLVRPHLEFASTVWNPYLKGDVELLEKIQRRATRIPASMKGLEYEERLKRWGLTTLEKRRRRGDLIQMYKVHNELENICWSTGPCTAPHTNTRADSQNKYRLVRESFSARASNDFRHFVTVRHEFFLNRTVDGWNGLASSQIDAPSLNSFKARIDK